MPSSSSCLTEINGLERSGTCRMLCCTSVEPPGRLSSTVPIPMITQCCEFPTRTELECHAEYCRNWDRWGVTWYELLIRLGSHWIVSSGRLAEFWPKSRTSLTSSCPRSTDPKRELGRTSIRIHTQSCPSHLEHSVLHTLKYEQCVLLLVIYLWGHCWPNYVGYLSFFVFLSFDEFQRARIKKSSESLWSSKGSLYKWGTSKLSRPTFRQTLYKGQILEGDHNNLHTMFQETFIVFVIRNNLHIIFYWFFLANFNVHGLK